MNKNIKDRTIEFVKYKGITMKSFELKCGLSTGYVTSMRKGFGADKLNNVLTAFPELNREWLLYGEGEMLKPSAPGSPHTTTDSTRGRPYYNVDFLGGFAELVNDQTAVPECYIDVPPYNRDGVVWCNITGHSMEPKINHGDIIALREVQDWRTYLPSGEIYAIVTDNDMRTVKIIRKGSDDAHLRLVPINKDGYDEQEIETAHIIRIYTVLACMKRF